MVYNNMDGDKLTLWELVILGVFGLIGLILVIYHFVK